MWGGNSSPYFSSHKQMKPRAPFIPIRGQVRVAVTRATREKAWVQVWGFRLEAKDALTIWEKDPLPEPGPTTKVPHSRASSHCPTALVTLIPEGCGVRDGGERQQGHLASPLANPPGPTGSRLPRMLHGSPNSLQPAPPCLLSPLPPLYYTPLPCHTRALGIMAAPCHSSH